MARVLISELIKKIINAYNILTYIIFTSPKIFLKCSDKCDNARSLDDNSKNVNVSTRFRLLSVRIELRKKMNEK